jgi:hypothetical protein
MAAFSLASFLLFAHLDLHRHGPSVAERVYELTVPLAPVLVVDREEDLRAGRGCLLPQLVDVS